MRQCAATRGCGVGGPFRSCPRSRAPRGGRGWIPAFAGKTVEPRRARASGYPEGGGGASGPLTRPRDGFLLSQERRGTTSCPRKRVPRGGRWSVGASHSVPGMDSCFRRNGCGAPLSCPSRVGAVREPPLRKQGSTAPYCAAFPVTTRGASPPPALLSPERRWRAQL